MHLPVRHAAHPRRRSRRPRAATTRPAATTPRSRRAGRARLDTPGASTNRPALRPAATPRPSPPCDPHRAIIAPTQRLSTRDASPKLRRARDKPPIGRRSTKSSSQTEVPGSATKEQCSLEARSESAVPLYRGTRITISTSGRSAWLVWLGASQPAWKGGGVEHVFEAVVVVGAPLAVGQAQPLYGFGVQWPAVALMHAPVIRGPAALAQGSRLLSSGRRPAGAAGSIDWVTRATAR